MTWMTQWFFFSPPESTWATTPPAGNPYYPVTIKGHRSQASNVTKHYIRPQLMFKTIYFVMYTQGEHSVQTQLQTFDC